MCAAFRDFLPGASGAQDNDSLGVLRGTSTRTGTPTGEHARAQKRKQPAEPTAAPASAPAKRRRKVADRDKDKDRETGRATGNRVSNHDLVSFWTIVNASRRRSSILQAASHQISPNLALSPLHHHHADPAILFPPMRPPHPPHRTTPSRAQPSGRLSHWCP